MYIELRHLKIKLLERRDLFLFVPQPAVRHERAVTEHVSLLHKKHCVKILHMFFRGGGGGGLNSADKCNPW